MARKILAFFGMWMFQTMGGFEVLNQKQWRSNSCNHHEDLPSKLCDVTQMGILPTINGWIWGEDQRKLQTIWLKPRFNHKLFQTDQPTKTCLCSSYQNRNVSGNHSYIIYYIYSNIFT
jgi:hypothetical protein